MEHINKNYYEYFCCPKCKSSLKLTIESEDELGIKQGELNCKNCSKSFPILNYIPRFVEQENYALNFGLEWEKLRKLRSDKYNKTTNLRHTILNRTGWDKEYLKGKLLLECGCGAGHDTEILLDLGANIITFDYSNSVLAAFLNNRNHSNLLIFQGDIYEIPLKDEIFDIVYCHRVIQHTPDPEQAFYSIIRYLKKGGEIFLHSYALNSWNLFHYHYILRLITKRVNFLITYKILTVTGPFLYRIVGLVQKIKKYNTLKVFLMRIIPFDNLDYALVDSRLTKKEKYYFSLFHVFDRLTPKYDIPNSPKTVLKWFLNKKLKKIDIRGVNPVILKAYK
ncbi:MAG: methyltransferase domain-containing protein [Promethearchaeota archaeon]